MYQVYMYVAPIQVLQDLNVTKQISAVRSLLRSVPCPVTSCRVVLVRYTPSVRLFAHARPNIVSVSRTGDIDSAHMSDKCTVYVGFS